MFGLLLCDVTDDAQANGSADASSHGNRVLHECFSFSHRAWAAIPAPQTPSSRALTETATATDTCNALSLRPRVSCKNIVAPDAAITLSACPLVLDATTNNAIGHQFCTLACQTSREPQSYMWDEIVTPIPTGKPV